MQNYHQYYNRKAASVQGTLSNWVTSLVSQRYAESQKSKISNRVWDLYLNDALSHGIIENAVQVVNTGITPQPQPMLSWLNKDMAWQEEYQRKMYDIFEIWGLDCRNFCDTTGRCNIYMLQALAMFYWKLNGIAVFQVVKKDSKLFDRPLSLSILPIDSSRLYTPVDSDMSDNIFDGIEVDKNGEIIAGWFKKTVYSFTKKECRRIPAFDSKTKLPNLLFVCDVRNISEYRQDGILTSMIKEIRDSNDFVDASLVKALIQNLWTIFVESDYTPNKNNSSLSWDDRIREMEKGTMIEGYLGEKPHFLTSNTPSQAYNIMNDSIIQRLGIATGRGGENIAKAYNSNYSASRAVIEEAGKFDDYDRMILVNRFCQPINMLMQYEAVLRGLVNVKVSDFIENIYAYTRTDWLPPKKRPIDHEKEAKSDSLRIQNKTKSYSDIYGEKSMDWRAALRQQAIEKKYIKDLEKEFGIDMQHNMETITVKKIDDTTN